MADMAILAIAAVSLGAATVNGALGYGYSSLTTPVALLMIASRLLNPALVIVEVILNLYALILGRRAVPRMLPRVAPLVVGLVPGVIVGSLLLAWVAPDWVKLITYGVLLPLILLQGAGFSYPLRRERTAGVPLGAGVGLLYSLTTISGPPLAFFFNNQRYDRADFKVALAIVRTAEASFTLVMYLALGLITKDSLHLAGWLLPTVMIGMPLGHWLIARIDPVAFRRACISFDCWLVGFGLARMLDRLDLVAAPWSYVALAIAIAVDATLLARKRKRAETAPAETAPAYMEAA
jgi:uncharacterized membrane protein YfcA